MFGGETSAAAAMDDWMRCIRVPRWCVSCTAPRHPSDTAHQDTPPIGPTVGTGWAWPPPPGSARSATCPVQDWRTESCQWTASTRQTSAAARCHEAPGAERPVASVTRAAAGAGWTVPPNVRASVHDNRGISAARGRRRTMRSDFMCGTIHVRCRASTAEVAVDNKLHRERENLLPSGHSRRHRATISAPPSPTPAAGAEPTRRRMSPGPRRGRAAAVGSSRAILDAEVGTTVSYSVIETLGAPSRLTSSRGNSMKRQAVCTKASAERVRDGLV